MIGFVWLINRWCYIILFRTFHLHKAVIVQDIDISHIINCCTRWLLLIVSVFKIHGSTKKYLSNDMSRLVEAFVQCRKIGANSDNQIRLEMFSLFCVSWIRSFKMMISNLLKFKCVRAMNDVNHKFSLPNNIAQFHILTNDVSLRHQLSMN